MNQSWTIVAGIVGSNAFTLLLSQLFNWRRNKVDETKIISDISAQLRQELFQKYEERGRTIGKLRRTIIFLTNLLDKLLPRIKGLASDEIDLLRDAIIEARLAGLSAEV